MSEPANEVEGDPVLETSAGQRREPAGAPAAVDDGDAVAVRQPKGVEGVAREAASRIRDPLPRRLRDIGLQARRRRVFGAERTELAAGQRLEPAVGGDCGSSRCPAAAR